MMPEWAEEYHLRTGDLALVTELLPHLRNTADYALRYLATDGPTAGLVTELGGGSGPYLHGIVDWPAPGRFGYDMQCAAKTTVNAQAYSALISTARLCSVAGQEDAAVRLRRACRGPRGNHPHPPARGRRDGGRTARRRNTQYPRIPTRHVLPAVPRNH